MEIQDKIRGMFLGTAIGDALGMPVEGFSLETIRERYGKLANYVSSKGHKWLDGLPLGSWTDDTHLTLAVARALIEDQQFTLMGQVKHHVKAMDTNTTGWGPTTKEAIKRLSEGVDPKESGIFTPADASGKNARGVGNGVCMKVAPLAAYFHAVGVAGAHGLHGWRSAQDAMAKWTAMTHPSSIAVSSCFAQFFTMLYCLQQTPESFSPKVFVFKATNGASNGEKFFPETLGHKLTDRLQTLLESRTEEQIGHDFNRGKSYVFDSLPFTYAYFLRDYDSIQSLYNVASAGGDTDTNASMVGALLGALHGTKIFPEHLVNGLHNLDEVEEVATDFNQLYFPL